MSAGYASDHSNIEIPSSFRKLIAKLQRPDLVVVNGMTWCHLLFRRITPLVFLVTWIAVPPGYSQPHSPRVTASIGAIDPPLERADRALHLEIEVSFPLTEFGSGRSSSVALSAGRWDTGVSSLGHCANYCTTVAHRAYKVGARIRRTFGAGPFSVHVQAAALDS